MAAALHNHDQYQHSHVGSETPHWHGGRYRGKANLSTAAVDAGNGQKISKPQK